MSITHAVFAALLAVFCLMVWHWVGSAALQFYLTSPYQLRNRIEVLFFVLCGPSAWVLLYKARKNKDTNDDSNHQAESTNKQQHETTPQHRAKSGSRFQRLRP